jgi:hypothetical protein
MNEVVIQAKNLTKIYRLYAGPGYRFLDTFGMLGNRPGAYTEQAATAPARARSSSSSPA